MILLIDNYDSFSYNLYQLIGAVEPDIKVVRNDECTLEEIAEMKPEAIILSPGPGRPEDAGICIPVIKEFAGKIPILGVCLGHQSICEAFGGTVSYAKELMHGKKKLMYKTGESRLFKDLPGNFQKVFHTEQLLYYRIGRRFARDNTDFATRAIHKRCDNMLCSRANHLR